ncbi:MAG: hypothetical protein P1U86_12965 [Verrucomicrobiales bacterium]|nr:hypothetical protein [Verrucomicrobiales bacterium]
MKKTYMILAAMTASAAFLFTSCEVEQTQEGKLPKVDVDVDAEPGQLPKFDVDAPEVDVSVDKKKVEIEVPDVDVDVKMPKDTDN